MEDHKQSRTLGILAIVAILIALFALGTALAAPQAGAHPGPSSMLAPAHESETPQATETQHAEASQTPEASHTPQMSQTPEASHTPQMSQTPEASQTPEMSHTPEASHTPGATETQHPEASETPEATETHHPEGTETPEATETHHPEGTETPEASHTPHAARVLALEPRLQFDDVQPGSTHSYHFTLSNQSANAVQVTLGATSRLGWTVGVSPDSIALAAGAHAPVSLNVSVPSNASGLDAITLVATDGTNTATAYQVLLTEQRSFSDLSTQDWSWHPVQFLATQNVISGYADGTFRPNNTVTRAQFAKMLVGGMGWALANPAQPTFSDVPPTNWAFAFVETAVQHGALAGYADGTFRPNTDVTRAQLAKLIVTARGWSLVTPASGTFSDVPTTNWAYRFVETAVDSGVLGGYADGTFRPFAPATRAQVAKILTNGLVLGQP